ncbi:Uncharacterised protein [uncultured archaeon]|nr:Uncharacterised protein [uncultured archaeon]
MGDILSDYFLRPIAERTGYNSVNTLAYAAIALVALYFIWNFMKKRKFDFGSSEFLYAIGAFVLFGSTCRVVTDLSDAGGIAAAADWGGVLGGVYSAVHSSGIFAYSYLTVTPGIYIVTAILFLSSLALGRLLGNDRLAMWIGLALWLPCLLLLLPFMANAMFFLLAAALAAIGGGAALYLLQHFGKIRLGLQERLAVLGQALDGAATFVVIDVFSAVSGKGYFEQHVLSAGIGTATPLGFGLFFLVKIALSAAIVYFLSKEKMDGSDKAFLLTVVAIMGFAPGIRDILRMLVGA